MKAIIKETGQAVEVVSRFMPKKRNVPSRDWMCNLSNGTCINESELEYISDNIEGNRQRAEECVPNDLEEVAREYAEKHGFRVPYDGSDNFYDDVDVKASKEGFIAGANWQKEKDERTLRKFFNDRNQGDASFYDLLAYLAYREGHRDGMDEQKEQMLKEAVDGYVGVHLTEEGTKVTVNSGYLPKEFDIKNGDKVRIIIVKED